MARTKESLWPWGVNDPCPCGRGNIFGGCCGLPSGVAYERPPNTVPAGDQTGYAHSSCYLSSTADCDSKITGEHYISEAILTQFGPVVEVEGVHWLEVEKTGLYPPKVLTAGILCNRHNSALSPLDAVGGRFYRMLGEALDHARRGSPTGRKQYALISGEALERWAFKTLLGLYHSKNARSDGKPMLKNVPIDQEALQKAVLGGAVDFPCGLYVRPETENDFSEHAHFTPLLSNEPEVVGGLRVTMRGFVFDFLIDPALARTMYEDDRCYRPMLVDLECKNRRSRIVLTWSPTPTRAIRARARLTRS